MKSNIIFFYQNVPDIAAMKKGAMDAAALIKAKTNGALEITIDMQEVRNAFSTVTYPNCVCVDPWQILPLAQTAEKANKKEYNVACLVFDEDGVTGPRASNPVQNGIIFEGFTVIQMPTHWYSDYTQSPVKCFPEVFTQFFLHELCHAWYYLTNTQIVPNIEDETHNTIKQGTYKTPTDYYLDLIAKLAPYYPRFTTLDAAAQPAFNFDTNLAPGATGLKVVELQQALKITGDFYNIVPGDTQTAPNFGPVTKKSVQRYQARKGITPVSGLVYEKTRAALNSDILLKKKV